MRPHPHFHSQSSERSVTEEHIVHPGTENNVKADRRRKENGGRRKARTSNYTASNMGNLETTKLE